MAEGMVGSGHQNKYKDEGTIQDSNNQSIWFRKGKCSMPMTAEMPPCWSAGTPVEFPGGIAQPLPPEEVHAKKERIDKNLELLVSTDKEGKPEYHPLIQLYNEIMADIFNHGMEPDLRNLENKERAVRLWRFLELRYLRIPRLMDEYCNFAQPNGIKTPENSSQQRF